jgi:hypothetical protein
VAPSRQRAHLAQLWAAALQHSKKNQTIHINKGIRKQKVILQRIFIERPIAFNKTYDASGKSMFTKITSKDATLQSLTPQFYHSDCRLWHFMAADWSEDELQHFLQQKTQNNA